MSRQHPGARMQDPAGGVPPQLLSHMHLVSSYRYPSMTSFTSETAAEYLLSAPKVVRELQPMHWMFLDGPPDGTVMLAWQPLNHMGTTFASDGYVWADVEQVYTTEVRGYIVEMWYHRTGYHPPNETVATHSRRRFRITGLKTPNANVAQCDPSLWIVHYSKAPSIDQMPANRIPVPPQVQNVLAQRRFLQSQGQLARKEFMLHDRNSWPTISLPPQVGQQGYAQGHPYAAQARQQPGQFFQAQQASNFPGGQGKQTRGHRAPPAGIANASDFSLDEEEVSNGDILDALTPRDISRMRYRNHHEWMEEVFASPYRIDQIMPVDLGLGRKGELESLTKNYFYAPGATASSRRDSKEGGDGPPSTVGKMESGKAEEFANAVAKQLSDMTSEIESMRKKHTRKLEKIKRTSVLKEAELELREAVIDPSDDGDEFWRVEGRLDLNTEEGMSPTDHDQTKPRKKVDDIVGELEKKWEKSIEPINDVKCVEKGGLQERVKEPPKEDMPVSERPPTSDINMGNSPAPFEHFDGTTTSHIAPAPGFGTEEAITQAGLGQEPTHTVAAKPDEAPAPNPTANNTTTTTTTTTANVASASMIPPQDTLPLPPKPAITEDVEMGGVDNNEPQPPPPAPENLGSGDGEADWVMVNKDEQAPVNDVTPVANQTQTASGEAPVPTVSSTPGTVNVGGVGTVGSNTTGTPGAAGGEFEAANFNTAGEALADYSEQVEGLDIGGLDNTAFGDAFHASEGEHEHHDADDIA